MKILFNFIKKLYLCRSIIGAMAVRDIQSRYIGTFVGFFWSIINPLAIVLVYWFVFSVGFRVQLAKGVPWIVVFMCGLIPWSMFTELLTTSLNSINANEHLIKKTVFPAEILPVVSLVTSWFTHAIMIILLLIIMAFNQISFSFANFYFLYYFFALSVFGLGLAWLISALNVFFKDVGQFLNVVINLWFWLTPIAWPLDIVPRQYQFIIKLNPMYYIVEGYKSSFAYTAVTTQSFTHLCLYYWGIASAVFLLGGLIFRKLKPEFAEVL
ncbi:MAG: hypothetical protein AUJ74_06305 [Candidatus Omnitrophica bacterium CG1_02_44_16]|nr:MAG: hypothetical protein AUJ74_06305 [Candidatus Omnitrophica bacterium CG1_02_44_16]